MDETVVRLIAEALINVERDFSHRAAAGQVQLGEFLTDDDKARNVLAHLADNGWEVVRT